MPNTNELSINPKVFRRGLDLGSSQTAGQPIEEMPTPGRLFVSLRQHRGGGGNPTVRPGDRVLIGQILGESADPDVAPVHAPVSGRVLSIDELPDPFGRKAPAVAIENDGEDEWVETPPEDSDFMNKSISDLLQIIRRSGLVRPASGRPVSYTLAPPDRPRAYYFLVAPPAYQAVSLLIINTMDSEPSLMVNRRLLLERYSDIAAGAALVKKIVGATEAVLVLDKDFDIPSKVLKGATSRELKALPVKYRFPITHSALMTTAVTGCEIPWPDGDPQDVGAVVLDLEVILGILDAARTGRPQIDRVVTIRGSEFSARNLRVRLGTPLEDLIEFAGGSYEDAAAVVVGGLMDGLAQISGQTPVTKQTRGVHVLGPKDLAETTEQLCFKCGRCVEVCPIRLLPNVITNFCEFGYFQEAEDAELFKCIECGCCAFVCPAKRPLVHYIKHGKAEVTDMRTADE